MMTTFQRSLQLFKASIVITFRNPKLLLFPGFTLVLTVLISLFFLAPLAVPVVLHNTGYKLTQSEHWTALAEYYLPAEGRKAKHGATLAKANPVSASKSSPEDSAPAKQSPMVSAYLLITYFLSMFLATFFNVAFYSEIIEALNSRGVSLRRGLALAVKRLPSILAWTLLAGVVGWMIRSIEERVPLLGRIVTGLIGLAWSVAAVFAIPVIIQNQTQRNPLKILRQSAETLKQTWGEGLVGYLGFSSVSMLIFLCSLVGLALAGGVAFVLKSISLGIIAVGVWLIALIVISYASSVASQVYRCVLFIYATEGSVPEPYTQELLDAAWKVKKG
jgi:hypothetical protein